MSNFAEKAQEVASNSLPYVGVGTTIYGISVELWLGVAALIINIYFGFHALKHKRLERERAARHEAREEEKLQIMRDRNNG